MILVLVLSLLFGHTASASLSELDKATIPINVVDINGGFESGKAGWVSSGGTFVTLTSGSNLLIGFASATWDSNGAAQTLTGKSVAIPEGLKGRNGSVSVLIKVPSGTATHKLQVYDGSNVIGETSIVSSSNPVKTSLNFIFPTSGNIQMRLVSVAADEPLIAIDGGRLGEADNIGNVAQAVLFGANKWVGTTNCDWLLTSTSFSNFPTDSDCTLPTVEGFAKVSATKTPNIEFNSVPPGNYLIIVNGGARIDSGADGSWRISDGTTVSDVQAQWIPTDTQGALSLVFRIKYDAPKSSVVWNLQAQSATGSTRVINNTSGVTDLTFKVFRFPLESEQVYRAAVLASSWSGFHDNDCSWARTSTSPGDPTPDASCTFTERKNQNFGAVTSYESGGNKLPGILFTPVRIGRYKICATMPVLTATAGAAYALRMYDGATVIGHIESKNASGYENSTTVCGIYPVESISQKTVRIETHASTGAVTIQNTWGAGPAIEWTALMIDQSIPAPVLVGSVTSSSTGSERVERAQVASACTGSPCTITAQSGGISSITRGSVGNYTINFVAGVFSSTPTCDVQQKTGLAACNYITTESSSAVSFVTFRCDTAASADSGFNIKCMGPR